MGEEATNRLRTMLGELLDHMEGAQEVALGVAKSDPSTKRWPERWVAQPIW
jgi:hypothetical protein